MKEYYRILKIEPGVAFEEVKKAYREKVKFWHPDRFPRESPRLQKKAHEQVSLINEAYKNLELHYQRKQEGTLIEDDFSYARPDVAESKPKEDISDEMKRARRSPGYRIFTWQNGCRYEGETLDNKMHGWGIYYYNGGDRYEGQFVESKPHGKGALYLSNGDKYKGEFNRDIIQGLGTYYYASGDYYKGYFVNGKPHGKGALKLSSGSEYSGLWKDGEYIG